VPRRHDHDAGGDATVLAAKAQLREEVWGALTDAKVTRFPGAAGRIPNFVGAERAAERLRGEPAWLGARTVKANPDSPQWPVRQRALEDRKTLFMAVPRLAEDKPFFLLDPARLTGSPRQASSIKGASRSAVPVDVTEVAPVDLVVAGCVAVGEDGASRPCTNSRSCRQARSRRSIMTSMSMSPSPRIASSNARDLPGTNPRACDGPS
jgi:5-formyltetrahydrofolate cyclo-ligase